MLEFLNTIRKFIISLFGTNIPEENDWGSYELDSLTPREILLRRA